MKNLQQFTHSIADYIDAEYESSGDYLGGITDYERFIIKQMLISHYNYNNSINNTANSIMKYLIESRL